MKLPDPLSLVSIRVLLCYGLQIGQVFAHSDGPLTLRIFDNVRRHKHLPSLVAALLSSPKGWWPGVAELCPSVGYGAAFKITMKGILAPFRYDTLNLRWLPATTSQPRGRLILANNDLTHENPLDQRIYLQT